MQKIIKKILISLINLISKSWRIKIEGNIPKNNAVVAFWHGEMLPIWKFFSTQKIRKTAVVSLSKDGELLSKLLEKWGYDLIRGSSSKNSKEVLNKSVEVVENSLLFITPDGPRGPAKKFKNGAAVIAYRTGVPIYLVSANTNFKYVFKKSWDKFLLPLPFSMIRLRISQPYYLEKELSRDEVAEKIVFLEKQLNSMDFK